MIAVYHLTKSYLEVVGHWRSAGSQTLKRCSYFNCSLDEENEDTSSEHILNLNVASSTNLSDRRGVPQKEFPETAFVVSELIKIFNHVPVGKLGVAGVRVFAHTPANCAFANHLDLQQGASLTLLSPAAE